MRKFQLIGAVAAAALAVVASASGAMAQAAKPAAPAAAAKPAAPAAAKPAANTVSGKIVSIDAGLSMVTLSDGKTYRITDAAKFKGLKVGANVNLVLPAAAKA